MGEEWCFEKGSEGSGPGLIEILPGETVEIHGTFLLGESMSRPRFDPSGSPNLSLERCRYTRRSKLFCRCYQGRK
jgi:hypothetical protein